MAEQEYDLIVVGSGAGAMLGAIRAQEQGLKTLVVEKTELFGGTSALSGAASGFRSITIRRPLASRTIWKPHLAI
jgi:succinate dehydrogenase/fumarate reductase flavoprotein subunit